MKSDLSMVFVGVPGSGKTTLQKKVAERLRGRAPVLVHDPTGEWEAPELEHHVGPVRPGLYVWRDPEADGFLTRLAAARGLLMRKQLTPPPLVVVINEGAAWGGDGRHTPSATTLRLITQRRHLNLGLLVGIQWASLAPRGLWLTATHLALFKSQAEDLEHLVKRHKLPRDRALAAERFAPGEHYLHAF